MFHFRLLWTSRWRRWQRQNQIQLTCDICRWRWILRSSLQCSNSLLYHSDLQTGANTSLFVIYITGTSFPFAGSHCLERCYVLLQKISLPSMEGCLFLSPTPPGNLCSFILFIFWRPPPSQKFWWPSRGCVLRFSGTKI